MATPYEFPSDLLAAQEELHQVRAELSALLKRLPWSVEPLEGFSDDGGWRKVERPASPGWTADEQAEVEKLRRREHELAVFITTHRFWDQFSGPEGVDARRALKHAHEASEDKEATDA
ncbi:MULTISPECIES: hypothetical protein [Streptomyces]|uniref:Uncharacterized protein n=1 Tax=Streptomyces thermoviolaceus subsp. thermoviolaceus TaxID=66860 RepID=A0ABX0YRM7_STRTL|nr:MULTISPECIES: hypothetical protein [Streptomyces]MCM3264262.1 hypothetical protein [Streptomyces thermoviolaceus]NJP13789.1 hypothetical protein [Streptomyces thermoviolaceus subsp. thermoviolaceus]RSR94939.1 hypothetical protein EF917_26470 [Streptomyces sp. WAC00469]WTD49415.1 hypothetical protein OG899_19020 [Streptomyces thermoviolaceus]GGV61026.1 hypothetical protein GCM10010499_02030 [Streptomyces thermoviolaceus subsp. apingens]